MKNIYTLFFGILFCIAFSWTGIVLSSQIQYGDLEPIALDEGEDAYPKPMPGIAQQGKEVYIAQGCLYCHSQQSRPQGFGADFAYTVDGGEIGELEYENFNAAYARINVRGISVHPGTAKGKLLNALTVALELNGLLPAFERPEYTEGYEGFYLLTQMSGDIVEANMEYIIRDHSREKFEHKKKLMLEAAKFLNTKYENEVIRVELEDSYYNMKEKIEPCMEIIELAKKSMIEIDIKPIIKPIRGGTDGARLSYKGLPCPNLFTGGHNFHGQYEYIPVQSMEKAVDLIVQIVKNSKDFK